MDVLSVVGFAASLIVGSLLMRASRQVDEANRRRMARIIAELSIDLDLLRLRHNAARELINSLVAEREMLIERDRRQSGGASPSAN